MALTSRQWAVDRHRYKASEDGPFLPGVTSIISMATDKPGIPWWAAEQAAIALTQKPQRRKLWISEERAKLMEAKGNSQRAIDKRELGLKGTDDEILVSWARRRHDVIAKVTQKRGQRIHDLAEGFSRGEPGEYLPEEQGYVDALYAYHRDMKPAFAAVECAVANPDIEYGGRFDAIVCHTGGYNSGWLLGDYKTGSLRPWENALQAAAYMAAMQIVYDEEGRVLRLDPLTELVGAVTISLHEDGTYQVSDPFENITRNDAWGAFLAARIIYQARTALEGDS